MPDTRHFKEELQELLDNRLTPAARVEVEKHLALCEQCRGEFEALRWTKQLSSKQYAIKSVPAKLEENILAALDLEDRTLSNKPGLSWNWWPKKRAMLAYSFLLIMVVVMVVFYFILRESREKPPQLSSKPESATKPESPLKPYLPSEVARDYQNYKTDKLPLMLKTEDVKEMERFFSEEGIPFETRVFDLGMMNYRLLGGRTHKLITRKSAFFVYRGKGNDILICQMYPGRVTELPSGAVLRENKGIQFYIYRVKDLTVAFWQEGAVICVLTSDMNSEQLVQLAFAKAVKV